MSEYDKDHSEQRLRQSLRREAETATRAGDGLARIRAGIQRRHGTHRRVFSAGVATATAAVVGVLVGGPFVGSGDVAAPDSPGSAPAPATPQAPPPMDTPDESPASTRRTFAVPVYYVGSTERGHRLYREFHRATGPDRVTAALTVMFAGKADDPDYASLWPAGTTVRSVTVNGDRGGRGNTATVDLSTTALESGEEEQMTTMAVQQLVYTVTGAESSVAKVQLLVDGQEVTNLWDGSVISQPVSRALQTEVVAPVWILEPANGATARSPMTFGGGASAFEATVNWEIRNGDTIIQQGHATATRGAPGRGAWKHTVSLVSGKYEIRAFVVSADDGTPMFADTKHITIR